MARIKYFKWDLCMNKESTNGSNMQLGVELRQPNKIEDIRLNGITTQNAIYIYIYNTCKTFKEAHYNIYQTQVIIVCYKGTWCDSTDLLFVI